MEYKQLGRSGLTVSVAGLGANNFGRRNSPEETLEIVDAAIELGINFIDTADIYGNGSSEELLGRVLKGHGNTGASGFEGVIRDHVIGTYLHGPLLPKNAWFADWLIAAALGVDEPLAALEDALEDAAHADARRVAGL